MTTKAEGRWYADEAKAEPNHIMNHEQIPIAIRRLGLTSSEPQ